MAAKKPAFYSRSAVKKLRGGYATSGTTFRKPTQPRTSSKPGTPGNPLKPINDNSLNSMFKKAAPWVAAAGLAKLSAYVNDGITAGGTKISLSPAPNFGDGTGSTTKDVPLLEDSSIKVKQAGNQAVVPSKIHKVSLQSGKRPSSSITKYMAMNGSTSLVFRDSRVQKEYQDGTQGLRDMLQLHGGFNQKLFYQNAWFATDIEDIFRTYDWTADTMAGFSAKYQQKFYGIASYLHESMTITNLNVYNAVDVKIHLLLSKRSDAGLTRAIPYFRPVEYLTQTNASSISWLTQRLPNYKVLKTAQSFTPYYSDGSTFPAATLAKNFAYGAYTIPSATVNQSQEFGQAYEVVHTVKRRLNPGDQLDFSNKIGLGSGLPLHNMFEAFKNEKAQTTANVGGNSEKLVTTPVAYSYLIEVVGQRTIGKATLGTGTEAATINKEQFTGTSPFKLQMEYKTKIEIANKAQVVSNNLNAVGVNPDTYPIKVYTSNMATEISLANQIKPFNRDFGSDEVSVQSISDDSLKASATI